MPTLSIGTRGTYDGWECIFKYEIRGYMSGEGTVIKINPYGYVILIRNNSLEDREDRFEYDEEDDYYNEDSENNIEEDGIKRIKIDETSFQKIKKIIDDNIKSLATMGGLEPEPYNVMDGCYSRIFLGGDNISIQAEVSNLGQYHIKSEGGEEYNEYDLLDDMWGESYEGTAENMTKLMNVFFKIRDILVENGIDERYFAY